MAGELILCGTSAGIGSTKPGSRVSVEIDSIGAPGAWACCPGLRRMSEATATDDDFVPYIAHDEFRSGASHGHFRVVVNPALARPYVVRRTRVDLLAAAIIGLGAVLALVGHAAPGIVLVALGIGANRLVRRQAGRILLHLATTDAAVYAEVTSNGMMEVRRA